MKHSEIIDIIRFPLAILVVVIHFMGEPIPDEVKSYTYLWFLHSSLPDILRLSIYAISTFAVPTFFLISGYLFFNKESFDLDIYKNKIAARFYTLFIPYVVWNIIRMCYELGVVCAPYILKQDLGSVQAELSAFDWSGMFISPVNGQMWFIRDLMVLCLITPILYSIIKRIGFVVPAIFLAIEISGIWPLTFRDGLTMLPAACFSFGACLSIKRFDIDNLIKTKPALLMSLFIFGVLAKFVTLYCTFSPLLRGSINVLLLLITIPGILYCPLLFTSNIKTICIKYAPTTFFIYAAHAIIGKLVRGGMNAAGIYSLIGNFDFFVRIPVIVFMCIVIYYFIKKINPKTLFVLSGNR